MVGAEEYFIDSSFDCYKEIVIMTSPTSQEQIIRLYTAEDLIKICLYANPNYLLSCWT